MHAATCAHTRVCPGGGEVRWENHSVAGPSSEAGLGWEPQKRPPLGLGRNGYRPRKRGNLGMTSPLSNHADIFTFPSSGIVTARQ